MTFHGWIVSTSAQVTDPAGVVHVGRAESLVKVETGSLAACLEQLPFAAEPIDRWNDRSDIYRFVMQVATDAMWVVDPFGHEAAADKGLDPDLVWSTYMSEAADMFATFIEPLGEVGDEISDLQAAELDRSLARAAKYLVAWRAMDQELLEESLFFSIAHLMESTRDLDVAITLGQGQFHKQARQVLRSLLELVVMPLHFCTTPDAFDRWREGGYRVPALRGKKGLLNQLFEAGVLDRSLTDEIARLYGDLSAAVHNAEKELALTGIFAGNGRSLAPSVESTISWARTFSDCVDAALRVTVLTVEIWTQRKPIDPFCATCHNATNFAIVAERFGDELYDKVTCQRCDSTVVRPLTHADPATELPSFVPGFKFRPDTTASLNDE